jgi:ornithine cyclodeaminase/alanine dehydrogenase-like protein (mu-crystallin family)
MKALYLKEEDIEKLVTVPEVIEALDAAFRDQSAGRAWNNPRSRLYVAGGAMHLMAAAIPGYFGYKTYTIGGSGHMKFFFFLYSAQTMDLLAMMEADTLGQKRTGATTGLATRVLANPDSTEATLFGAGWQAQTQLLAMDAARNSGGNSLIRREFDDEVVLRSDCLVVDSIDQCKIEAGEFLTTIESGKRHWEDFTELRDVVAGCKPGRTGISDITVFKSGGIAIEDVAIGKVVYERAIERGAGRNLDM